MDYDESKVEVDEMILALVFLTSFSDHGAVRSCKGNDRRTPERLREGGLIGDPVGKANSVVLAEEGEKRWCELFQKFSERTGAEL
jgi:hypothetical protein